jgi:hypothetical protein
MISLRIALQQSPVIEALFPWQKTTILLWLGDTATSCLVCLQECSASIALPESSLSLLGAKPAAML